MSGNRRFAATCSRDGTAIVWDVGSGKELSTLNHGIEVTAVSFGADGETLFTASHAEQGEYRHPRGLSTATYKAGGVICRWDWERSRLLSRLDTLERSPRQLALSPDGKRLSFVDFDFNYFEADARNFNSLQKVDRLQLKGQVGLFPTPNVSFGRDARHAVAVRSEEAIHSNGNKVYALAVVYWDSTEKKYGKILDPQLRIAYARPSFEGDKVLAFTQDLAMICLDYSGKILERHDNFTPSKVVNLWYDDAGKSMILQTEDGRMDVRDAESYRPILVSTLHNHDALEVRLVGMDNERILVLRGGYRYASRAEFVDGAVRVQPEKLLLESYPIKNETR